MSKPQLRREARAQRRALATQVRARADEAICRLLMELPETRQAGLIMTYVSLPWEVDTRRFIRLRLADGGRLCAPRTDIATRTLSAWEIHDADADLAPGAHGVLEPAPERCAPIDPKAIDLVLTPGLLFDRQGHRLGYGGGYFDRLLADLAPQASVIGLAYSAQMRERLPADPWDRRVHAVVTEREILRFE